MPYALSGAPPSSPQGSLLNRPMTHLSPPDLPPATSPATPTKLGFPIQQPSSRPSKPLHTFISISMGLSRHGLLATRNRRRLGPSAMEMPQQGSDESWRALVGGVGVGKRDDGMMGFMESWMWSRRGDPVGVRMRRTEAQPVRPPLKGLMAYNGARLYDQKRLIDIFAFGGLGSEDAAEFSSNDSSIKNRHFQEATVYTIGEVGSVKWSTYSTTTSLSPVSPSVVFGLAG
ncbi:hypothetical protein EX30DRAFT_364476 [Ascodesmis nigricans]|uniref:Uncharacterized protein n=1 Tax=Ascodesmis nigricans TaxID=341454 RepID=A0A4S2MVA6_9PEZI|nr:hypothetical protein EX30DRAFT_364476 [Ascodesmis nigricans]